MTSAYVTVPPDPGEVKGARARLHTLLKEGREVLKASDLDHAARESLRADLSRLQELEGRLPAMQGRSVAVFSCTRHGLREELILPRRVHNRLSFDATPYVRPLLAVAAEFPRYCVVVVDQARAWFYVFHMGALEEATKLTDQKLRKPDFAGQHGLEEYRVRNRAEELLHRHFRHTAADIERLMEATAAQLLIVGGHESIVPRFLPFLSRPVGEKLAGTFVVDPHTMTPGRIRELADHVADSYERNVEAQLVARALEQVATGGLAAEGLPWCLMASNEKAIQELLVHDSEEAPGRACDNCGWLGLDGATCPVCGHQARATPDIIDEMAAAVVDASGTVKHVYADTPLSSRLVAAYLRFPVERPAG